MIAPLSLEDADIVEQLWLLKHTAYRLEAIAIGLQEYPPLPDTFDSIRNSDQHYYGWFDESGELKGAIALSLANPDTIEITRIMVHITQLRQGIGSALLQHVLQTYPHKSFEVTAGVRNVPAISLYTSFGFIEEYSYYVQSDVELARLRLERT